MDPVVIRGGDLLLEGFGTQLPDIMDEPFIESENRVPQIQ
jgi:hypothetical protein